MLRILKSEEYALLRFMIEQSEHTDLIHELNHASVTDMKDGAMGSLRFAATTTKMGSVLCEAESVDSDNIPLKISINLDEEGHLFELDIWKVNFSPLRTYPAPSTLHFLNPKP